jgi:hypothetical protein
MDRVGFQNVSSKRTKRSKEVKRTTFRRYRM